MPKDSPAKPLPPFYRLRTVTRMRAVVERMVTIKKAVKGLKQTTETIMSEDLGDKARKAAASDVHFYASAASESAWAASKLLAAMRKDVEDYLKKV